MKRLLYIGRDDIRIENHPVERASAVFNPALLITGDSVIVYARIVYGYYMYVSSIARFSVPLNVVLSGRSGYEEWMRSGHGRRGIEAEITVYPDNKYDMVGTEDPRIYQYNGRIVMTYCGRSISYYNYREGGLQASYPVTAYMIDDEGRAWRKKYVHRLSPGTGPRIREDRDAFLLEHNGQTYLFHRPTTIHGENLLLISRVLDGGGVSGELSMLDAFDPVLVLEPAPFEEKIGWATPPVRIGGDRFIAFIHGVDRELTGYHLFAAEISIHNGEIALDAVTPGYIMSPKTMAELYGERSYTVFPTGSWGIDDGDYLIGYGAGDLVVGLGTLNINEVAGELDKGRVY